MRFNKSYNYVMVGLFAVMCLTLGWFSYKTWVSYTIITDIVDRDARIIELRGNIVYLDAMLTSSTTLVAYTNDLDKYRSLYDENTSIDKKVDEMAEIAKPDIKKKIRKRIRQINKRLEEIENKVFQLVGEGKSEKAKDLVNSANYMTYKAQFQDLINDLDIQLIEVKEELDARKKQALADAQISSGVSVLLLIATIFVGYGFINAQRRLERDIQKRLNEDDQKLQQMSNFAEKLGQGNYAESLDLEDDALADALIRMRDKLKEVAEEDRKRNWSTQGQTKIADILRGQEDIKEMGDKILSFLLDYVEANQGGIYVMEDEDPNNKKLVLTSYFAFQKKKFIEQEVNIGQGLVGQAAKESKIIYLTEIPNDYIQITSGLGEANPRCIAVVPLIFNERVEGILEIASFTPLEEYKLDFLEEIGESIASSLSALKVNARTKKLLDESQELTTEMRQKEEEMRQNMEELMATQEDAERRERELNDEINRLRENYRMAEEEKSVYRALLKEHNITINTAEN